MYKIESLKDYIGKISDDEMLVLANNIFMITEFICADYPNHKEWFFTKQFPQTINSDERNIFFIKNPCNNDEIISCIFIKKDDHEEKICTLYVDERFRNQGIATSLIDKSIEWLGNPKPLCSITKDNVELFESIIKKYAWELQNIYPGLYVNDKDEYCFNGTLDKTYQRIKNTQV